MALESSTSHDAVATVSGKLFALLQDELKAIRELISCKICYSPLYEPYTTSCGHTFCYSCLCKTFEPHKAKNCPECRTTLDNAPAPSFTIREITRRLVQHAALLPDDESVEGHSAMVQEHETLVKKDRNAGIGLFKGLFVAPQQLCPYCDGQVVHGLCLYCGYNMDYESNFSEQESEDLDDFSEHTASAESEEDFDMDDVDHDFDGELPSDAYNEVLEADSLRGLQLHGRRRAEQSTSNSQTILHRHLDMSLHEDLVDRTLSDRTHGFTNLASASSEITETQIDTFLNDDEDCEIRDNEHDHNSDDQSSSMDESQASDPEANGYTELDIRFETHPLMSGRRSGLDAAPNSPSTAQTPNGISSRSVNSAVNVTSAIQTSSTPSRSESTISSRRRQREVTPSSSLGQPRRRRRTGSINNVANPSLASLQSAFNLSTGPIMSDGVSSRSSSASSDRNGQQLSVAENTVIVRNEPLNLHRSERSGNEETYSWARARDSRQPTTYGRLSPDFTPPMQGHASAETSSESVAALLRSDPRLLAAFEQAPRGIRRGMEASLLQTAYRQSLLRRNITRTPTPLIHRALPHGTNQPRSANHDSTQGSVNNSPSSGPRGLLVNLAQQNATQRIAIIEAQRRHAVPLSNSSFGSGRPANHNASASLTSTAHTPSGSSSAPVAFLTTGLFGPRNEHLRSGTGARSVSGMDHRASPGQNINHALPAHTNTHFPPRYNNHVTEQQPSGAQSFNRSTVTPSLAEPIRTSSGHATTPVHPAGNQPWAQNRSINHAPSMMRLPHDRISGRHFRSVGTSPNQPIIMRQNHVPQRPSDNATGRRIANAIVDRPASVAPRQATNQQSANHQPSLNSAEIRSLRSRHTNAVRAVQSNTGVNATQLGRRQGQENETSLRRANGMQRAPTDTPRNRMSLTNVINSTPTHGPRAQSSATIESTAGTASTSTGDSSTLQRQRARIMANQNPAHATFVPASALYSNVQALSTNSSSANVSGFGARHFARLSGSESAAPRA